jgi:hypothetical protein
MITSAHVQADVVDIRNKASAIPSNLVADANVFFWIFYPNFSSLQYAGGRQPLHYQLTDYLGYWKRAATANTKFHAAAATFGEFAKTAENAELEAIWLMDSPLPQPDPSKPTTQFDPRVCKFARYHYSAQLGMIRNSVDSMIASVRKSVGLLEQFPTAEDQQTASMQKWLSSHGDFPDAVMISTAQQFPVAHILSDDMDIATFAGITLYTASQKVIDAAKVAGKLK